MSCLRRDLEFPISGVIKKFNSNVIRIKTKERGTLLSFLPRPFPPSYMHSSTFSPPHTHLVNFFRLQPENHLFRGLPKSESIQSESEVAQSCPTLCDPMDPTPPGSSVHGIFQARILEWVAISFSRRSSRPKDWTWVSSIVSRHFTIWATKEDLSLYMITKRCRYSLVLPFIWSDFHDLRYLSKGALDIKVLVCYDIFIIFKVMSLSMLLYLNNLLAIFKWIFEKVNAEKLKMCSLS